MSGITISSSKNLMLRDRVEYSDYFSMTGFADSVSYYNNLEEAPSKGDVLLFDEADFFIFADPAKF